MDWHMVRGLRGTYLISRRLRRISRLCSRHAITCQANHMLSALRTEQLRSFSGEQPILKQDTIAYVIWPTFAHICQCGLNQIADGDPRTFKLL